MSNPLRSIVRARLKDKQDQLQGTPGQLGDSSGTVSVPGRPGYVYVRLNNSTQVVEAYNSYAPLLRDLRVHVGYDPRQPQVLQVVQIRPYLQTNHATPGIVQNHHTSHEWMSPTPGGNDVVYSQLRQLMPLRVSPAGGLSIQVYRGVVWTGTGYVPITTTTLDLTSYVPTTLSKQCLVLITVSTSGTLVATKLAEQDWGTLDAPVSSDIPSDTAWVLGAVRLYNGQLAVEEARTGTDILDLRWPMWSPLSGGGSGGGDVVTEGPGIDIVTSSLTNKAIGIGGDSILLYHTNGDPVSEFEATSTGFDLASSAAASGDVIRGCAVLVDGDHVLTAGVVYIDFEFSGQITCSAGSVCYTCTISRAASDSSLLMGILPPGTGLSDWWDCKINLVQNGSGNAYGVYLSGSGIGSIYFHNCDINSASVGGSGYACYANPSGNSHSVHMDGGSAIGSTHPCNI